VREHFRPTEGNIDNFDYAARQIYWNEISFSAEPDSSDESDISTEGEASSGRFGVLRNEVSFAGVGRRVGAGLQNEAVSAEDAGSRSFASLAR
jgi:hypothetical protein